MRASANARPPWPWLRECLLEFPSSLCLGGQLEQDEMTRHSPVVSGGPLFASPAQTAGDRVVIC